VGDVDGLAQRLAGLRSLVGSPQRGPEIGQGAGVL
jgi:hypothetical protein